MKICQTCGLEHPDDVTTSHHPPNCSCGQSICSAKAATLQEGCIWCHTIKAKDRASAFFAQGNLIFDREAAIIKAREQKPV